MVQHEDPGAGGGEHDAVVPVGQRLLELLGLEDPRVERVGDDEAAAAAGGDLQGRERVDGRADQRGARREPGEREVRAPQDVGVDGAPRRRGHELEPAPQRLEPGDRSTR
ncbi:MAG: hypothetical protein H6713_42325 [Myxococcales bacterium]|nr:hypothetical protein [Myxococcales bacterium]